MKDLEKKIELAAFRHWSDGVDMETGKEHGSESSFITGALSPEAKEYWQEGMYTEEEVQKLLIKCVDYIDAGMPTMESEIIDWFEQNKKK